jgi:hypothetical protein
MSVNFSGIYIFCNHRIVVIVCGPQKDIRVRAGNRISASIREDTNALVLYPFFPYMFMARRKTKR